MGVLLISISKWLQPENQDCNSDIFVPTNVISYKSFEIYVKMKILPILFLTAMVAIEKEQCSAKYLLVDIDNADGREPETRAPSCGTTSDCSTLEKCCDGICVSQVSPCVPINKSEICETDLDCSHFWKICCPDGYCRWYMDGLGCL